MKEEMEKILQEEQDGLLLLSCDSLEETVTGELIKGSFQVFSPEGKKLKGRVIVSDPRIVCREEVFQGESVEISYSFDSSVMEPGETVSGSFDVLTNYGERQLSFTFHYPQKVLESSLGEIKNLFHFTNLARSNWEEAVKLYFSSEFEQILANADSEYKEIYKGLSVRENEQYMDEFLQAVHKKDAVTYAVEDTLLTLENLEESQKIEILVRKNGWGYTHLIPKAQGDFLSLEKEGIREEDFTGNVYVLPVYIDYEKLHQGRNWGEIILSSPYESIKITVLVSQNQHHRMRTAIEKRKSAKELNAKLTELYVNFRSKNMAAVRFKKESEEILEALQKSDERNPAIKLYSAHLYITQEKYPEAKWMLDRAAKYIQEEKSPVIYAYYLYLTTLLVEEEEYVSQVKEKVNELYYNYEENWQIAWLFMYLSKELRGSAQKKWEFLKGVFVRGCTSPVMYMEAVLLLIYQPTLLNQLGEIELRILWFGQKRRMLTPEIIGIFQYLTLKEKEFSMPVYRLLKDVCKENEHSELLQALCSLLIKGNKTGEEYLEWYEKAILAEIKITRLYEYYMMSLDRKKARDIPRMVLLYFSYQTELNTEYAAYLYRYIYENRDQMEDLYLTYAPGIERFVVKKLYGGKIDEDLGYLYEHILLPDMLTEDNAKALVKILFTHELQWKEKEGEKLIIRYPQKQQEEQYSKTGDRMVMPVYTRDYVLLREDKRGNRFVKKDSEKPVSYIDLNMAAKPMTKWGQDSLAMALYLCTGNREWQNITWEWEPYFRYLSECEDIKPEERMELRIRLMNFYFEMDAMEKLDVMLEEVIPYSVKKEDRKTLLQYMAIRDYYEKAYEFIRIYDPQNIDPKILVRVSSYMLEENKGEKEILLWYINVAFRKGKYNVVMLQYLIEHYRGSSRYMKEIFKAARNFEIATFQLSERLLMQILTTKAYIGDEVEIFKDYVAGGAKSQVEVAFLTYRAVEYMRDDREIDPYLIMDIGRVYKREEELPLVTHLAYLRYFSENSEEREKADMEVLQEFLQEIVVEKELILPFLLEYADMEGMEVLADKTLISYRTVPKSRVVLHYRKSGAQEEKGSFKREEMQEVCFGIYVKECILFYGEELQYYITEEQENQEQFTKSGILRKEDTKEKHKQSRYQKINDMAMGQVMQDYDFVCQELEEYWKTEFVTGKVFYL